MKRQIPLRKRYFRDVSRMGMFVLLVCMVVLTGFNLLEFLENKADQAEELWEMILVLLALAGVTPLMMWMAWTTSGRLLRPLEELQDTVDRMSRGELQAKISIAGGDDEITELLNKVESAFEAHREALRRMDRFSADVSHQLRTPLTAMRTAGEASLARERTLEEYQDTMGRMLEQSDHLAQVVDQLLLLARVGGKNTESSFEPVALDGLTRQVLEEFTPIWEDRGAEIETDLSPVDVNANPTWLCEAFRNLLNNATLYTPDPARFRIRISVQSGMAVWCMEDSGPGISADRRERIFDRFQRGSMSDDGGAGLGLAIVQEVARIHKGRLYLETSPLGGCAFKFEIQN